MADKNDSLYGQICEIVRQQTIYLRHYLGQVTARTDDLNIGMVQVSVPELGWMSQDEAPWCYPRQLHSLSVPEVGEWVEVYFLNGDMNKPVYIGLCNEMKKEDSTYCIPSWYTGDPTLRIVYQSPKTKKGICLNETDGEMLIDADTITLIDKSTEPFVLGTKLNSWLTNFVTSIFNSHTHLVTVDPSTHAGATVTPLPIGTAPTDILSTKIMGK